MSSIIRIEIINGEKAFSVDFEHFHRYKDNLIRVREVYKTLIKEKPLKSSVWHMFQCSTRVVRWMCMNIKGKQGHCSKVPWFGEKRASQTIFGKGYL